MLDSSLMTADTDHNTAEGILRKALGDEQACFRDGQWEAIRAVLDGQQLLVVQRTGWGKSAVYFVATRLLRTRGTGPTLLLSPLLALMRNQCRAAQRFGLRAETLNSENRERWPEIIDALKRDQIDLLIVSPERLGSHRFREELAPVAAHVGLLVVDEAHCISDWGHDFRPDYQRITHVLRQLAPGVPVLGTTATANNRVVSDVQNQLGGEAIRIDRGLLRREGLQLQTLWMDSTEEKMAWLAEAVPELVSRGLHGIVYILTVQMAERLACWLREFGVRAESYHSRLEKGRGETEEESGQQEHGRAQLECRLLEHDREDALDVLVATSALGMGFDMPDLGFVIHFSTPRSLIEYYQQVGRAGRAVTPAYGILLGSPEDDETIDYFIENALPSMDQIRKIIEELQSQRSNPPVSIQRLETCVNLPRMRMGQALNILSLLDPPLVEEVSRVGKIPGGWRLRDPNCSLSVYAEHERHLLEMRRHEQAAIQRYRHSASPDCLMWLVTSNLNDLSTERCGECSGCRGAPVLCVPVDPSLCERARAFMREQAGDLRIEVKKRWPNLNDLNNCRRYDWTDGKIVEAERTMEGRVLAVWNDPGWGRQVARGYAAGAYSAELADALAELIQTWQPSPQPTWIVCVPSAKNPAALPNLAEHVARRCGERGIPLEVRTCLQKVRQTLPQQTMRNSWHQLQNLDGAFEVDQGSVLGGPVLLLDDVVNSGWTLILLASVLRRSGSGPVFPLALARRR